MKKILIFLFLLIIGVGSAFLFPEKLGTTKVVDFSPPSLHVNRTRDGVTIAAEDHEVGIKQVKLSLLQGEKVIFEDILLDTYRNNVREIFTLPLSSFQKSAKEGEAEFIIATTDNSFWSNSSTTKLRITFDFIRPKISVHSLQHRMNAGGAELILFEASDNQKLAETYLEVDENLKFSALQLGEADERFKNNPNMFGVLFAVPRGFLATNFKPKLVAVDEFGNRAILPITLRFDERPLEDSSPNLSDKFLEQKIPPLLDEMKSIGLVEPDTELFPKEAFPLVNENYRRDLQLRLQKTIYDNGVSAHIPTQPFIRPMAGSLTSKFGEARTYLYNGEVVSSSVHEGQDIASVIGDTVMATYQGKVILSEPNFGIYGGTILIDHGFGIVSLYGHLSSLDVNVGDIVSTGQRIGNSGETGLAGGDHLHFEIRIQNVPVTPIEWWDTKWFQDDFQLKFEELLSGGKVTPVE